MSAGNSAAPQRVRPAAAGADAPLLLPASLNRRFEAIMIGWDGLTGSDQDSAHVALGDLIDQLGSLGVDVYVIARGSADEIDGRLRAGPRGPGRLYLCVNNGADMFRAGAVLSPVQRRSVEAAQPDDPAASVRWVLADLAARGIGPGLVLAIGGDLVQPGNDRGQAAPLSGDGLERVTLASVTPGTASLDVTPPMAPFSAVVVDGGLRGLLGLLADQVERRRRCELPEIDDDPAWTLAIDGLDPRLERVHESLLAIADGRLGTRASPLLAHRAAEPGVLAAGVYGGTGSETELLSCPAWTTLPGELDDSSAVRRRLDLHTGVLRHDGPVAAVALSSLTRPGTVALRVRAAPGVLPRAGQRVSRAGLTAAIIDVPQDGGLDRVGAYAADEAGALAGASVALDLGFDRLLAEQREAWAARWARADVTIDGDPEVQLAVRLALFHLMASVADAGEAAVGARGLSGHGYRGHVFWDSDVFVLPFLAATHPSAARAMLEYRVRRLAAARAIAAERGRRGARFPWESAGTGFDVTPPQAHLPTGEVIRIATGESEEHIVADVAWAASCYLEWTGDATFGAGPGREILVETARYWASRIRLDAQGRAHIDGVIGPDEYHEAVDDNAFTNVMARWNLRRAAALGGADAAQWLSLAERLVDGFDPATRRYEQFAGFYGLEPLLVSQIAPRRPIAADLLLGRDRVAGAQVIKQADVLMLHHLVPDEVATDSLGPNLDFYEPRTAHGSSLSPAIHASVLARAGRLPEALTALRIAARIDLDDLTGSTASGVHLATMGGLWQAIVFGFAGVRPRGSVLIVDPHLPPTWNAMQVRLCFRDIPFTLRLDRRGVELDTVGPLGLVRRDGYWEVRAI
jgi:trehalose/maltose hydrolase-like predicted phosphorylase